MRIVAGEYASRVIKAPPGKETRPTLDKVREAVFSSLGGYFDGGLFLDLYAGSGANGLEALSRGMDEVYFVDSSYKAIQTIKDNVQSLQCESCHILHMKDMVALKQFDEEQIQFDYVYLDPPYEKQHNTSIMEFLYEHDLLKDNATIIIESLKEDIYPKEIGPIHQYKEKVYGIAKITYYRYTKL